MNLWRAIIGFFAKSEGDIDVPVNHSTTHSAKVIVKCCRSVPPRNSSITLTKHDTGIIFDFPLKHNHPLFGRTSARGYFEIALHLLVLAVLGLVVGRVIGSYLGVVIIIILFGAELIYSTISAHFGTATNNENAVDGNLRKLTVVGNMLVSTSCDQRKRIWYQHEIREIVLEQEVATSKCEYEDGMQITSQTFYIRLVVMLHSNEEVELTTNSGFDPLKDFCRHAEMEWVATQLRLALFPTLLKPADNPLTHAHQVKDVPYDESRYTE